jgi:hypothetical protein
VLTYNVRASSKFIVKPSLDLTQTLYPKPFLLHVHNSMFLVAMTSVIKNLAEKKHAAAAAAEAETLSFPHQRIRLVQFEPLSS